MSVDKFGRILSSSVRGAKGERDIGYNLTNEGDYDMQMKNIKNFNTPIDKHDATTKTYAEKIRNEIITIGEKGKAEFFKRKVFVDEKY